MRSTGRVLLILHKTVSRWLVEAPKHSQQTHGRQRTIPSLKLTNSAFSSLKKSKYWFWLAVVSIFGYVLGYVCSSRTIKTGKVPWQQRSSTYRQQSMVQTCKGLLEFHSTHQVLCEKDLHHTNRIIDQLTQALFSQAPSQNTWLHQIKNDVGSSLQPCGACSPPGASEARMSSAA